MLKICQECGAQFETSHSTKKFCDNPHYRTCVVCGKSFFVPRFKLSLPIKTCSEECRRKAIALNHNQSRKSVTKICEECGAEFETYTDARYCSKQHYRTCVICGKVFPVSYQQLISDTKTCCRSCAYELSKQTLYSHYGVTNPAQSDELLQKAAITCQDRYGESCVLNIEAVEEASKSALKLRHDEIESKKQSTCQDRYGVKYALQNETVKSKSRATWLQNYGVDNPGKIKENIYSKLSDPSKIDKCIEFHTNPPDFIIKYFPSSKPTLQDLAAECGMKDSSIGQIILDANCEALVKYTFSTMEDAVYKFLVSILPNNISILRNTFRVISPYELDLYLPEYKLAIECNPTITHNSTIAAFSSHNKPKPKDYHKMKTDMCADKNILLFHIFGYEWEYKQDVIKSMLRNLLGLNSEIIHARKTQIQPISDTMCFDFLEHNHRQGGIHAKIRLGLFLENKLVSVMTFSKMRNTIGSTGNANVWELSRFCNVLNTSVVGGASKLFKYFVHTYNPEEIRSFSDRAHTKGKLYKILGFEIINTSNPGYVWVDLHTNKAYNRVNAQKRNIQKFLHDDTIDLRLTEIDIMRMHNFVQVFDSGTITWRWKKSL